MTLEHIRTSNDLRYLMALANTTRDDEIRKAAANRAYDLIREREEPKK